MSFARSSSPLFLTLVSAAICVVSALAIVHTKHESRRLFVELEALTAERDRLNIEWGQLQIEQSTWATHARIEQVARDQLSLARPQATDVYVIERPIAERPVDGRAPREAAVADSAGPAEARAVRR